MQLDLKDMIFMSWAPTIFKPVLNLCRFWGFWGGGGVCFSEVNCRISVNIKFFALFSPLSTVSVSFWTFVKSSRNFLAVQTPPYEAFGQLSLMAGGLRVVVIFLRTCRVMWSSKGLGSSSPNPREISACNIIIDRNP